MGATITLSCLGDGRFQRDVDFLFDAQDITGVQYALDYLQSKGSGAEIRQDTADEGLLCRVSTQGTAEEISREMSALFGEQNVMKYAREGGSVEVYLSPIGFRPTEKNSFMTSNIPARPILLRFLLHKNRTAPFNFLWTAGIPSSNITVIPPTTWGFFWSFWLSSASLPV